MKCLYLGVFKHTDSRSADQGQAEALDVQRFQDEVGVNFEMLGFNVEMLGFNCEMLGFMH